MVDLNRLGGQEFTRGHIHTTISPSPPCPPPVLIGRPTWYPRFPIDSFVISAGRSLGTILMSSMAGVGIAFIIRDSIGSLRGCSRTREWSCRQAGEQPRMERRKRWPKKPVGPHGKCHDEDSPLPLVHRIMILLLLFPGITGMHVPLIESAMRDSGTGA